jgi:hypothetical protein
VAICIGLTVGVRIGVCGAWNYPTGTVTKMYADMTKQIQHTTQLNKHHRMDTMEKLSIICTVSLLYYVYISLLKKSAFIGHYSIFLPHTDEITLYITH